MLHYKKISLQTQKIAILCITTTLPFSYSTASENNQNNNLKLIINGASYHFHQADHNQKNYGFGIAYTLPDTFPKPDFMEGEDIAAEFDIFKDSFSDTGISAAVSWTKPLSNRLNFGLKTGLLHSDHLLEQHGTFLFPYIVPFLETYITDKTDLRTSVVPPLGDITYGYMMFSINIKLN